MLLNCIDNGTPSRFVFLGSCRNRIDSRKGPHAICDAPGGKGNERDLLQLRKQGSLVLSGRKIVKIDGDVTGMLHKAGRFALGEETRGCEGWQFLLQGLITVIFAVLLIVDSNRIGRGTHIRQGSSACRGYIVAYPLFEFGKGERADRFAGRNFGEERERSSAGGSFCGRIELPLH